MTVLYIFCFFSWLPFFDGEIKLYKTISASQLRWPDEDVAYRRVYCTLVFALQLQTQNPPVLTTSSAVYRLPEPSSSDCCLGLLTEFTSADGRVPYEAVCRRTSKSVGLAAIVFFSKDHRLRHGPLKNANWTAKPLRKRRSPSNNCWVDASMMLLLLLLHFVASSSWSWL